MRKVCLAMPILVLSAWALIAMAPSPAADLPGEPVLRIDFSDYSPDSGSVRDWIVDKGFAFERDAKDYDGIVLSSKNGALHLRTERPAFGMIYRKGEVSASRVRIVWGVSEFPEGASYEAGVHDEALMLYVFFGREEIPSGSWYLPDSPYFLGLFLCDSDRIERPYEGRYYKDSGRFVCVGQPNPGERVVSEFDLAGAFEEYFGKGEVPVVSAISLEVDTKEAGNDGRSAAFIEKIELLR